MFKKLIRCLTPLPLAIAFASSANAIILTGTIRDFNDTHPDFENGIAVDPGIVEMVLGADQKPVYAGGSTGTTHGQEAFDQWYRNTSGVNLDTTHDIELADLDGDGIFTFVSNAFFPIDGQLFGNQGRSHNFHFTYEIHSQFTYKGGEIFTFTGDDDLWVFINGKLAIDLGGVHGALTRAVDLDAVAGSLGITVGNTYDFDLFFAERHTSASNFRIETSLVLEPIPEPLTIMGAGIAAGFGAFFKRIIHKKIRRSKKTLT